MTAGNRQARISDYSTHPVSNQSPGLNFLALLLLQHRQSDSLKNKNRLHRKYKGHLKAIVIIVHLHVALVIWKTSVLTPVLMMQQNT